MSVATGSLFRPESGPSLRCSLSLRARLCCMSVHVRAPMCTHAHRGGCAHVCICASVYVCTRVCVYDCTHTSLCMCVHAHASVSPACAPVCMCLRVHACVSVCTYVRLRPLVRLQWAGAECDPRVAPSQQPGVDGPPVSETLPLGQLSRRGRKAALRAWPRPPELGWARLALRLGGAPGLGCIFKPLWLLDAGWTQTFSGRLPPATPDGVMLLSSPVGGRPRCLLGGTNHLCWGQTLWSLFVWQLLLLLGLTPHGSATVSFSSERVNE